MKTINMNDGIEVHDIMTCYLCGTEGYVIYRDLHDKIFGAPGKWDLKKCRNPECELIWLDPMPTESDLHKVYETYYTHQVNGSSANNVGKRNLLLRPFHLVLKFGHKLLVHITGMDQALSQAQLDLSSMYLTSNRIGSLLDIGCGNGVFLDRMRSLGWNVQGVEVDQKAASVAEKVFNIPVFVGTLEAASHSSESLDAITMNHVIEHVHDPIALLQECARILKPGGYLIVVTPNARSLGHVRFGQYWRGLEPPRHLHLFSQSTLQGSAHKAGFRNIETWTTPANAEGIAIASLDVEYAGRQTQGTPSPFTRAILSKYFQLRAFTYHWGHTDSGEEVILRASK
jgi:2-polyprenyl-3-methyl-5-hydroxy-6-metoxy-1,4-benzoquinol methylase